MKKLLVLGAIPVLIDIVKEARKRGYYVIVTDYIENSPAKKYADESWMLSIDDVDGIVAKCQEDHVDGVMNYCLDPGQKPYQQICELLNIPCVATFEQFDVMTNKDKFTEACKKYGVGVIPEYRYSEDVDKIEYPVMVKPVDSRASKGLYVCHEAKDLAHAVEYALGYSKRKTIRIEKLLHCPEVCAKYFVVDGEIFFTSMADVFTSYEADGTRVYLGTQTYPSRYYDEYMETTHEKVVDMLRGIGIRNGATSFTGFYDNGVFRFFDPSLRMGGAMDWKVAEAASGIDISNCLTNFAMTGSMGDVDKIRVIDKAFAGKYSALLYFDIRPGTIGSFEGVEEALKSPCVFAYHQNHFVGDTIHSYGTANSVAIRFVVSCDSREEFITTVRYIQHMISIKNIEGENMITPMFDPHKIAGGGYRQILHIAQYICSENRMSLTRGGVVHESTGSCRWISADCADSRAA